MKFVTFLVFLSSSYQECYKHKDIIVPTKYVIDQEDIEISKYIVCLRRKNAKISARSLRSLVIIYEFCNISSLLIKFRGVTNTRILLYRQNMWLSNKILRSRSIVCLRRTNVKISARSLRSLVIIYEICNISSILIKFISGVLQTQGYYCTDKICDWPTRYWDLEESYGLRRYNISQVSTLLIKAISWLLYYEQKHV